MRLPILFLAATLAGSLLTGCQSAPSDRLSDAETEEAVLVGFTVANADRCAVPHNQQRMLDGLLEREAQRDASVTHHNAVLKLYNDTFEGTRRKLSTDLGYCTPERLAQTKADIARFGG